MNSGDTLSAEREERNLTFATLLTYVALVKPWIVVMVLVSTLGGIFMAHKGLPDTSLIVWTLFGVGLATASAAALNNFIDTDIDARMKRTSRRPTASGAISPENALATGLVLAVSSVVVMSYGSTPVASSLCIASIFIYVVPYTYCLKRTTPLATFVGGIAGAFPPVIGYVAVKQQIDLSVLCLFLVLYVWQHPHFWALALKYRKDYTRAGVMNLPASRGVDETKKQIALWSVLLLIVSTLPYMVGMTGTLYLSVAVFTGALFVALSFWFLMSRQEIAMNLFFYSIVHLPMLYCAMVVDIIQD